ncbi:hypothetical protein NADE_006913 [Nannochloris sp. 'desiccata']|nr:hypothetical protein NADE_006913 [Chlorella desiccata (nom. nud.)]
MARFIGSKGHTGLAVPAWLLSTAGFAILLGGIASMQSACGGSGVNSPIPPGLSSPSTSLCGSWSLSSYSPAKSTWLAPCLLPFLLSQQPSSCSLQTLGTGLTGVGDELDGTFKKRARTALAGAAIAAASEFHVADGVGPPRREGHRPFLRNAKKWGTVRVMWRLLYP